MKVLCKTFQLHSLKFNSLNVAQGLPHPQPLQVPIAMLSLLAPQTLALQAPMLQPVRASRAAVSMGVSDLPGISTETGNVLWDPLGLSKNMDESNLNLIRAAELKHCRVAMLATVGWSWTATGTHFEGMLSFNPPVSFADAAAAGNPIAAAVMVPGFGVLQMLLAIGTLEILWEKQYPATKCAGNFGVPAVTQDPEKLKFLQDAELKNGRLAMIGIISFACAVGVPGSVPLYPY